VSRFLFLWSSELTLPQSLLCLLLSLPSLLVELLDSHRLILFVIPIFSLHREWGFPMVMERSASCVKECAPLNPLSCWRKESRYKQLHISELPLTTLPRLVELSDSHSLSQLIGQTGQPLDRGKWGSSPQSRKKAELKSKPKTNLRMKGRTARFTTRAGLAAGSMRRTHDLQTTIEREPTKNERTWKQTRERIPNRARRRKGRRRLTKREGSKQPNKADEGSLLLCNLSGIAKNAYSSRAER